MSERAMIRFISPEKELDVDLDVPVNISANELISALNNAYELGINISDIKQRYLKAENPTALLRGSRTLESFGVRNGTVIRK